MTGAREPLAAALAAELDDLAEQRRLRRRPVIDSPDGRLIVLCEGDAGRRRKLINWAGNDYLGFSGRITVKNAATRALRSYGAGAGASRLLAGGLRCHRRLEQRLAHWLDREEAVVTTTGYQANLAVLVSLASSAEDAIICDRLCHASTYDGARLSAGGILRFAHNDVDDLVKKLRHAEPARRVLVCVESVYSMDGDEAPLADIAQACDDFGASLVVDEDHAIGVIGEQGRGRCHELGLRPAAVVGTCSKGLGSQGGFISGDAPVVEAVVNHGRSFIYSTAPVPAAVGAAVAGLDLLRREPELPARLQDRSRRLRQDLAAQGWQVPMGRSAIVPLVVGDEERALALAAALAERGHHCPAIRPPTVPQGACRLRLTPTLAHTEADLRRLVAALGELRRAA